MSFGTRHSAKRKSSMSEMLHKLEPKKLLAFDCKGKLRNFVQTIRESHSTSSYWDILHLSSKSRRGPPPKPRLSITIGPEERGQLPWFSRGSMGMGASRASILSVESQKLMLHEIEPVILGIPKRDYLHDHDDQVMFEADKKWCRPSMTTTTISTVVSEW